MTLNDISKKAGVSVATVSRVFRNSPGVKPSTRKRVLTILRNVGYDVASLSAPQQITNPKKRIDVIIYPLQEQHEPFGMPYYATLLDGIRSVLIPRNFDLQVNINFTTDGGKETHLKKRFDGTILVGAPPASQIQQLEQEKIPYVILANNPIAWSTEVVSVDKFQESLQLVERLVRMGIRRLGLLIPKIDYSIKHGVIAGLCSQGLELADSDVAIANDTDLASFVVPIQRLLAAPTLPEVMICINSAVLQLYQEMLKNSWPEEYEQMRYVFFSDYPQKNCDRAIHLQIDTFQEGVLSAEWLINKISRRQVKDNYRIYIPMNYLTQFFD